MVTLEPDCAQCFGLCCVALSFSRSRDFAFDKDAGSPCRHLTTDDACAIHAELPGSGMRGCVSYECFGAGQHVSQVTYGARSWRDPAVDAGEMFAVLEVVRRLHEMLVLLDQVRAPELRDQVRALTDGTPAELLGVDLDRLAADVGATLTAASRELRGDGPVHAGVDWVGRDLRTTDLRRADLRGALLIAADLRGAALDRTDLLGADLRDADLGGADLRTTLFLTQPQLNPARGDATTLLPTRLRRPASWG